MTRKDFELIAATVRDLPDTAVGLTADEHWRVALAFADMLRTTNPRFDRDRFLSACGEEE